MKLLFMDIETTGFSRRFDYMIEIAAILYDTENQKELAVFHEYIKPKKKIPPNVEEITRITNQQVAKCRDEADVLSDFIKFIEKHNPESYVGHNIDAFDITWFKEKSIFYFFTWPEKDTIDTLKIARKVKAPTSMFTATGQPSYKQESIAKALGIEYGAHSAIEDVKAMIKIYNKITTGEVDKTPAKVDRKRIKLGF
jgi:DNA polymerase III subunit epsilon